MKGKLLRIRCFASGLYFLRDEVSWSLWMDMGIYVKRCSPLTATCLCHTFPQPSSFLCQRLINFQHSCVTTERESEKKARASGLANMVPTNSWVKLLISALGWSPWVNEQLRGVCCGGSASFIGAGQESSPCGNFGSLSPRVKICSPESRIWA